ncbi:hypothetical protein [Lihuaxuella thermophila]|uniref:Uncharacterized protein n=1 Tax=Lihuaxuella thermophila TaxID=1173111 RepID=A0A1H8JGV0_9BACL|nr:hypothetical protein [Lihuaxuella thermophila]SEN79902.1 hypothetical protein SAMN05444955_12510 [Lihuaxuella thermophila]
MSLVTVKTAIMNVLNAVPDVTAFSYEPKSFPSLPAVTVNFVSFEQTRHSFQTMGQPMKYDITYTFELRLYVSMGTDAKTATETMDSLIDKYLAEFRKDLGLAGTVRDADITRGELTAVTDVQSPYYLNTFTLQITEEV